ncbi:MAG: nucleotidyltransferase family protein [Candidatus Omnitrophica bacterium]|jgi:hypothetical protein|nr:nucleotidyltransferase family protein [Candidatus Omnitrophota bacterium]
MSKAGTRYIQAGNYLINRETKLISLIAQWVISDRRPPEIKEILTQGSIDWGYFNQLLTYHEFYSFAYICLGDYPSLIPASETDLLKKAHYYILVQLADLEHEFLKVSDIFREQQIDFLPLKGMAFLIDNMYGNKAGLRPMADIDILIKKECFLRAEKLIEALDYRKELFGLKEDYWRKRNYHIAFTRNNNSKRLPVLIEVHWLLDYPGERLLLPDLWEKVKKIQYGDKEFTVLADEDMLFCLALHLRRFGKILSLKSACDFACILVKNKDLDWDYILREAERGQMCASLYYRLIQANILFGIQVPGTILSALNQPGFKRNLIERFVLRNTFSTSGDKDKSVFLKNHLLVYDNLWKPVSMIMNIPQEQFSKFYHLNPYGIRTLLLYQLRFLCYLFHLFVLVLSVIAERISSFFVKLFLMRLSSKRS